MDYYSAYLTKMKELAEIAGISSLLSWDQEIYLPSKGGEFRAQQLALINGLMHEKAIDQSLTSAIDNSILQNEASKLQKLNLKVSKKDIERKNKLSRNHIEESTLLISKSFEAWESARKQNDFDLFKPYLKQIIELKRREADLITFENHPYDALLDEFEPGMKVETLDILFGKLRIGIQAILNTIPQKKIESSFMFKNYPNSIQWKMGLDVLEKIGFDFEHGRQDISTHPFTITFSPQDVRITTRIDETNLNEMLWSCLHEGGHALYEQGLSYYELGTPISEAASLGIHESQSRFWENHIGRGKSFWSFYYTKLQAFFPEQLSSISEHQFYCAMNEVKPSLIRTSADELTYHMHIIIRYEIEKALIDGSLHVDDLKEKWQELYRNYLGIDVPNDNEGILQDVHWAHGSFGYFPTYTLGSLYAAQINHAMKKEEPQLEYYIAQGDFTFIKKWLKSSIFDKGRLYTSEELCEQMTGEKLNDRYFLEYATDKFNDIYIQH
jgi:carboxypeptidase Taq